MTVLLFGSGTDYTLFISARWEELRRNEDKHEAMRVAMRGVEVRSPRLPERCLSRP